MNSLGTNLEKNARVLVKAEYMAGNPTEAERVFVCRGGFGMHSFTHGSAIMGYWEQDGEQDRIEGFMLERLLPEQSCCCTDPVHPGDNPNCQAHWVGSLSRLPSDQNGGE